jgi:tRNA(fMet)-specific endonuclease VapC
MELIKGASLSSKQITEKQKVFKFLATLSVISLGKEEAILAGQIETELTKKGEIIETEDIMIGAIAKKHNQTILTRNLKHFNRIPDLSIETY